MKTLTLASVAAIVAAFAASGAQAATEVELRDVAAKVVVVPENRSDVELKVAYGTSKLPVIMVHTEGSKFVADGKLKHKGLNCRDGGVKVDGFGTIAQADLPTIYIKVPMDAKIASGGATFGKIANTTTLDFSEGGCGAWTLGDVAGKSQVNIGGSGDITGGNSGNLEVNIGGSGNYTGGTINAMEANIGGNGDILIARANGKVEINIGGSGDVTVTDGNSPSLEVNIAGSGDVRFGGTVKDVSASIVGSGDISVKTVTGNISRTIMGSGHVNVGK